MALPVPLATYVLLGRRRDPVVHAASANASGPTRMVYVLGEESRWGSWIDRVQRVTATLREAGHDLSGFDLLVRGTIPLDAGLGSGCSLTVALLRALRQVESLSLDDAELARIAVVAQDTPLAALTARAQDHSVIVSDGDAHELVPLPHDLDVRVLQKEKAEVAPEGELHDVEALVEALRSGDRAKLLAAFDTRMARESSEVLAARRVSRTATLALVKREAMRTSQAA